MLIFTLMNMRLCSTSLKFCSVKKKIFVPSSDNNHTLNSISAHRQHQGFPGGSVVKHLLANAGASGDMGLIPGWKGALEEETAAHSRVLVWEIPWTEEPGRLQFMRSQRVRHDWVTTHICKLLTPVKGQFCSLEQPY